MNPTVGQQVGASATHVKNLPRRSAARGGIEGSANGFVIDASSTKSRNANRRQEAQRELALGESPGTNAEETAGG